MKFARFALAAMAAALALPATALAHEGHVEVGFMAGLTHPFSGLDHLLAMAAVGWLAVLASQRGATMWRAPGAFLGALALGAGITWAGLPAGWAEIGALVTLAALAGGLLLAGKLPMSALFGLAVAAGLAHGAAHATEGAGPGYLIGMLAGSTVLHAIGLGLGVATRGRALAPRLAGAAGLCAAAALAVPLAL